MKADIVLLRRSYDTRNKVTGIGVYSEMIKSLLEKHSLVFKEVFFKLTADEGHIKCVSHGFLWPIHSLRKLNSKVYHATDEFCCLVYPFFKGKKITTFHHVFKKEEREGKSPALYFVWDIAAKSAIKYSDVIIAVSEQTKSELVEILGADPNKVVVMKHAADSFYVDLKRPRKKMIGFVGTLIERKNVAAGIKAFKRFTEMPDGEDYTLVICGGGPLKDGLVELSKNLGIQDKVSFISNISQDELRDFYNDMVVFINPSLHEGLGLTAMEARACGTPVVYFEDAEIPSEIAKSYVPSKDIEDFANNIHKLVFDDEFRDKYVNDSLPGLSVEEYSKKLFEIYSAVSGERFP